VLECVAICWSRPPLPAVALYMYVYSECVVVCWSVLECVAVCFSRPPLPVVALVYSGYVEVCWSVLQSVGVSPLSQWWPCTCMYIQCVL